LLAAHIAVHEVLNAYAIATAECFAIGVTVPTVYPRVPVLIAIIYIGTAMVSIVFACALDAVTKAATLNITLILRWRRFP